MKTFSADRSAIFANSGVCAIQSYCLQNEPADLPLFYWRPVHGGVNDVGNTLSEKLFGTYKTMVAKLVKSKRKCIITGILPKYRAGMEWSSRALGMNERETRKLCKENNIQFLDYWGRFWDKKELYSMDGYHFSRSGVLMLSELYEKELTQGN